MRRQTAIYIVARILIMALIIAALYAALFAFVKMPSVQKGIVPLLPPWFSFPSDVFNLLFIAFTPISWFWSGELATRICRPPDLLLKETQIETITRGDRLWQVTPATKSFLISKYELKLLIPSVTTFIAFLFGYMLFDGPHRIDSTWLSIALIVLVCGIFAIFSWINIDKPLVEADFEGIKYCSVWGLPCKFIAWDEIYSCDAIMKRDEFGQIAYNSIVLKNARQKKILKITIAAGSRAINYRNARHLVRFIKQVLRGEKW